MKSITNCRSRIVDWGGKHDPQTGLKSKFRVPYPKICILLACSLHIGLRVDFSLPPLEDAAMLMRYAENLGHGRGFVYNPDGPAVDGATDFLTAILLGGLVKLGIGIEWATRGLIVFAHIFTALLIYGTIRVFHRENGWLALGPALFFAVGNGASFVSSYFAAPVFALAVAVSWFFVLKCCQNGAGRGDFFKFGLAALAMGMVRPEGVFMAVFMLMAVWARMGSGFFQRKLPAFLWASVPLGLAYFCWRLQYFGHPLPNPYYVKGLGQWQFGNLLVSAKAFALFLFPLLPLFFIGFFEKKARQEVVFPLVPIVGFLGIWVLLSNDMNWHYRFQYAILPIGLVQFPAIWRAIEAAFLKNKDRFLGFRFWKEVLFCAALVGQLVIFNRSTVNQKGGSIHKIAKELQQFAPKKYKMAVSEAGLLPFYSTWETLDVWGLNDARVAHSPTGITAERLAEFGPDLIVVFAHFSPQGDLYLEGDKWYAMCKKTARFAVENKFELVACFGRTPEKAYHFYLKKDCPDFLAIEMVIAGQPFLDKGEVLFDFKNQKKRFPSRLILRNSGEHR